MKFSILKQEIKIRYCVYLFLLMIAAVIRFSTPIVTILEPDAPGYLFPTLNYFLSGEFIHISARSYPYSLILLVILSVFKNINAICVVQHISGLVTGFFLFIGIEHIYKKLFVGTGKIIKITFFTVSIGLICSILLNGNFIRFEKMLRPEGIIFPSLIVFLNLLYVFFTSQKKRTKLIIYFLIIFLSAFYYLLFPRMNMGFIIIALLIIFYEIKNNKPLLRLRSLMILISTISIFLIVILPENYLVNKYDQSSKAFPYKQFLCSNAPTALKAIKDSNVVFAAYDYNYLKKKMEITTIDRKNQTDFPILQYNMDILQYELGDNELKNCVITEILKNKTNILRNNYKPTKEDTLKYYLPYKGFYKSKYYSIYNGFYKSWFKLIITKYPFDVIKKSARQILFVLFHPKINFLSFGEFNPYKQSFEKESILTYSFMVNILNYKPDESVSVDFSYIYALFFKALDIFLRIVFIFALLHSTILFFKKPAINFHLCVYLLIIISLVIVAVVHSFDYTRYIQSLTVIIIPFIYSYFLILLQKYKYLLQKIFVKFSHN